MTPEELADRLERAARAIGPAVYRMTVHTAEIGRAQIKGHASGRPGPNVITGAYRNSWQVVARRIPAGASATIGTDATQADRLEFGFSGTDALGRSYHQPPLPHAGPAIPVIAAAFRASMKAALQEALT